MQAHCLLLLRKYDQATLCAARALSLDPDNATAWTVLAECEQQNSVSNPFWSPDTILLALEAVLYLEKPEDHLADLERLRLMADAVLQHTPQDPNAFATKTFCSIVQGNVVDILKLLGSPPIADKARELMIKTLPLLETTLAKTPGHIAALTLKAGCLSFMAQWNQRPAIASYLISAQLDPNTVKPDQILAIITGVTGPMQTSEAQLASAEELLKRDPKNRLGYIAKIEALRLRQQYHDAAEIITLAIQHYPQDDFLWALRALCCLSMNDPNALEAADLSLELNRKTNELGWLAKLTILAKEGKNDRTIAAAEAVELYPGNPLLNMLITHYQSNERSKITRSQDADE